jgi:hypothetical protein
MPILTDSQRGRCLIGKTLRSRELKRRAALVIVEIVATDD